MEIPKGYKTPTAEKRVSVGVWALYGPMREFVITQIKKPLQNAIERATSLAEIAGELFSAIKKIPALSKENTDFKTTDILLEMRDLFIQYHNNPGRQKLMESVFNLDIFEYDHDGYYAFIQDWAVIYLAMELAKGNYVPRFKKFPEPGCWTGPDIPDIETIRQNMREALN